LIDSRETDAIKFQLTQDVFDALIPGGSLGYLPFMDEGLIGLAGVVSSLMGGYTQWLKTK
jgi:peroxin-11B